MKFFGLNDELWEKNFCFFFFFQQRVIEEVGVDKKNITFSGKSFPWNFLNLFMRFGKFESWLVIPRWKGIQRVIQLTNYLLQTREINSTTMRNQILRAVSNNIEFQKLMRLKFLKNSHKFSYEKNNKNNIKMKSVWRSMQHKKWIWLEIEEIYTRVFFFFLFSPS